MKYIFSLLLLVFSLQVYSIGPGELLGSKSSVIEGVVIDENTGEGLAGVEIKLLGSDKLIYTDFDGNFSFENLSGDKYSISAEYISYKRKIILGVSPGNNNSSYIIKLKPVDKSGPQTKLPVSPKA
ncbi:MAG: carboxypeptidase-like regulatory domain-containing protein [Bacteroidales bacterium]|nr:carboxypeptidase-like regulatory domain-containing protein [Bacteroidales bacterium]MCB8998968.1 carboxypeptidase-like regulatory domain-containing protein [Bacteroidales bacterium]MCB9013745.1 carboxypeptidase-like regulatory domain-containing protein [Bacteroidales bacterium]